MTDWHRNDHGLKNSCDMYRTFNGERYPEWSPLFVDEAVNTRRIAAYRSAGVKCRRVAGELYVRQQDQAVALQIDMREGWN